MMEDIVNIKTSWAKNLIAKIAMKALKAAGYDVKLQINEFEIHGSDSNEYLVADASVTVQVKKRDLMTWLER